MTIIAIWWLIKILFVVGLIAIVLFLFIGTASGRETLFDVFKFLGVLGGIGLFICVIGAVVLYFIGKALGIIQ